MTAYFSLGILFLVVGLVFLLVPFDKLKTVFRRMRHSITTKVGGAIFLAAGIVSILLGLGH